MSGFVIVFSHSDLVGINDDWKNHTLELGVDCPKLILVRDNARSDRAVKWYISGVVGTREIQIIEFNPTKQERSTLSRAGDASE